MRWNLRRSRILSNSLYPFCRSRSGKWRCRHSCIDPLTSRRPPPETGVRRLRRCWSQEQGRYRALDPSELLSTFLENGQPDAGRFIKTAGDFIATALKTATGKHPRVAVCGECGALLHADGKAEAAVEMEGLWDDLASMYNVDSLCGYPIERFRSEDQRAIFRRICAEHSAVYSH